MFGSLRGMLVEAKGGSCLKADRDIALSTFVTIFVCPQLYEFLKSFSESTD